MLSAAPVEYGHQRSVQQVVRVGASGVRDALCKRLWACPRGLTAFALVGARSSSAEAVEPPAQETVRLSGHRVSDPIPLAGMVKLMDG